MGRPPGTYRLAVMYILANTTKRDRNCLYPILSLFLVSLFLFCVFLSLFHSFLCCFCPPSLPPLSSVLFFSHSIFRTFFHSSVSFLSVLHSYFSRFHFRFFHIFYFIPFLSALSFLLFVFYHYYFLLFSTLSFPISFLPCHHHDH